MANIIGFLIEIVFLIAILGIALSIVALPIMAIVRVMTKGRVHLASSSWVVRNWCSTRSEQPEKLCPVIRVSVGKLLFSPWSVAFFWISGTILNASFYFTGGFNEILTFDLDMVLEEWRWGLQGSDVASIASLSVATIVAYLMLLGLLWINRKVCPSVEIVEDDRS